MLPGGEEAERAKGMMEMAAKVGPYAYATLSVVLMCVCCHQAELTYVYRC